MFNRHEDMKMIGLSFNDNVEGLTEMHCLIKCIRSAVCFSVNFYGDDGLCEMGTLYQSRHKIGLDAEFGVSHYSFINLY